MVNKAGGGGTVGPTYLATRKPNGYTIGVTSFSPMGVAPHLMKVNYKIKDFAFIAGVCRYLYGIAVKADSPYKTFGDLMKAIESGKRLTMATPSPVQYIIFPRLAAVTGKKMDNVVWVRYKSGKQTTVALLGGHVDLIVGNPMDIAPPGQDRPDAHAGLGLAGALAPAAQGAHPAGAGLQDRHRLLAGLRRPGGHKGRPPRQAARRLQGRGGRQGHPEEDGGPGHGPPCS